MAEKLCVICNWPERDHKERNMQHAFTLTGELARRARNNDMNSSPGAEIKQLPQGDPVLRMALIRAGVITPEDLTQVENELKATGISHT